jgi:hypothetical protein
MDTSVRLVERSSSSEAPTLFPLFFFELDFFLFQVSVARLGDEPLTLADRWDQHFIPSFL